MEDTLTWLTADRTASNSRKKTCDMKFWSYRQSGVDMEEAVSKVEKTAGKVMEKGSDNKSRVKSSLSN